MNSRIKLLAMDVDGTLTDGKIHISDCGEIFKSFDSKDGYALKILLPEAEIIPVIITGRHSKIVELRAQELNIVEVMQDISDKARSLDSLTEKYRVSYEEIAFIGDDLNDLSAMKLCGVSGCPADAVDEVKSAVDYVCNNNGGCGAVREFVEWIVKKQQLLIFAK